MAVARKDQTAIAGLLANPARKFAPQVDRPEALVQKDQRGLACRLRPVTKAQVLDGTAAEPNYAGAGRPPRDEIPVRA